MVYLLLGFFMSTIGITVLNCLCDLINSCTEYLKARIGVGIVKCNKIINDINETLQESDTKLPIGFALSLDEEEEENEE